MTEVPIIESSVMKEFNYFELNWMELICYFDDEPTPCAYVSSLSSTLKKLEHFPNNPQLGSKWMICKSILTNATSQLAITCSKLTIETLEQGVKYVQSWQ